MSRRRSATPTRSPPTREGGVPYAGLSTRTTRRRARSAARASLVPFRGARLAHRLRRRHARPCPDEGILTRPGHRRADLALRRYLTRRGVDAWSKPDPAALGLKVPKTVRARFTGFEHVFERYGAELYICARVPPTRPRRATWSARSSTSTRTSAAGRSSRPPRPSTTRFTPSSAEPAVRAAVHRRRARRSSEARRFVILQGPPGTGKTRMADEIRRQFFGGRGNDRAVPPGRDVRRLRRGLSPDAQDRAAVHGARGMARRGGPAGARRPRSCWSSTRSTAPISARCWARRSTCSSPARSAASTPDA